MKLKFVFIGVATILVVIALSGCLVLSQEENKVNGNDVVPHKLFDFARFKQMFNKKYSSVMEELARQRIFFARAFKAFLSFFSFKNKKSSTYLKINEMSDWTQEEFRSIELKRPTIDEKLQNEPVEEVGADLSDIEAKLREIVQNQNDNLAYATIAKELKNSNEKSRKRRDIVNLKNNDDNNRDSLKLENLFEVEPIYDEYDENEKLIKRIPSNNPNYEPPELDSNGADDDDEGLLPKLSEFKTSFIKNLPSFNIINNIVDGTRELFTGVTRPVEIIPNDLPDEIFVDHNNDNCLVRPKHQSNCGSCYIFSTMALYEWKYCIETGQLATFSEQYAIDCGDRVGMNGCKGGQEMDVSKFLGKYGVELTHNYPYHAIQETCPYEKRVPATKMGYLKVNQPKLKQIKYSEFDYYIKRTPILLGFGVSDEFHHYGGGVDLGEHCNSHRGHSMLVVGSGREDGVEYWLVRNSYGRSWGLRGHYKIAKLAKNCYLDGGIGYILDPDRKAFGSLNRENDGSAVKKHVDDYYAQQGQTSDGLPSWLKNRVTVVNSNIATPPPDFSL